MQGNQPLLHIRAGTHFLRAAEQDTDFARAHGTEQRQLRVVGVVILNEGDFVCRDAQPFQFVGHVIDKRKSHGPCGVDKSQNTSCAKRSSFVASQMR